MCPVGYGMNQAQGQGQWLQLNKVNRQMLLSSYSITALPVCHRWTADRLTVERISATDSLSFLVLSKLKIITKVRGVTTLNTVSSRFAETRFAEIRV